MPNINIDIIKDEYNLYRKGGKPTGFGEYMNTKYNLGDIDLVKEMDNNMAMLRILKDYVMDKE
jgi:hypothetical protein